MREESFSPVSETRRPVGCYHILRTSYLIKKSVWEHISRGLVDCVGRAPFRDDDGVGRDVVLA